MNDKLNNNNNKNNNDYIHFKIYKYKIIRDIIIESSNKFKGLKQILISND